MNDDDITYVQDTISLNINRSLEALVPWLSLVHIYTCDVPATMPMVALKRKLCEHLFADCRQCLSYIGGRPGKLS